MSKISRREALQRLAAFGFTALSPSLLLPACTRMRTKSGRKLNGPLESPFERLSPIARFRDQVSGFSGDNPDRFHGLLWNKANAMKQRKPLNRERHPIVIVGGGMSGILMAYLLRDLKPVLLDKSERFGGNSQGEAWEGVEYSIGAAYLMGADKESPLHELYKSAGIFELCRKRSDSDPVLLKNKVYTDFWNGQTDPDAVRQFRRVRDFFLARFEGRSPLPSIPPENNQDLSLINELDRYDFLSYLIQQLGEPLHPHVHALLELYCWSTLGGSMQELSAAIGLTSYAWEFGDVLVAQAGNSSIAERYLQLFLKDLPLATHARPSCVALDVKPKGDTVDVTYMDQHGVMRAIEASAVVMACPKFVAKRLIDGLEQDRKEALEKLEYRSYVVANACLNRPTTRDIHDLYLLNEGEIPFGSTMRNQHNHGSTDAVYANYGQIRHDKTVLTIYHPLPFKGGRAELNLPNSHDRYTQAIREELFTKILPPLGYYNTDLAELRLTRWGHPIPIATPGFYFSGTPQSLSKPFQERIFFVNQDNWAAPAIETCAMEALKWAPKVREVVS